MKLLDHVRETARVKHFSYRTEQAYVYWAVRYIRFHGIKHPNTMAAPEVEAFLTHLIVDVGTTKTCTPMMKKAVTCVMGPMDRL